MQYSNELKVGAALILTAVLAFAGIRFFQDLPLFGNSYYLYAEFEDASGLKSGNPVKMKGVNVGSVDGVELDSETQTVRARLQMKEGVRVPEGSKAQISGVSALGGVHIGIDPGPSENARLASGATLLPPDEESTLKKLTNQAPGLANKADSVLTGVNTTLGGLNQQLQNPNSDLRQTLTSLRTMSGNLEQLTETEQENIRDLLDNLESVSSDLKAFTADNGDSLDVAVHRLNQSLNRLNSSLASLESTSAQLDAITTKLNNGTGTAGRLVNDSSLYIQMDTAATRTNRILLDFQENPSRYLDDLTLVKMF